MAMTIDPIVSFQSASPSQDFSGSDSSPSFLPVDENGDLETSDPNLKVQQQLVKSLFSPDTASDDPAIPLNIRTRSSGDSVELSRQAIDLHEKTKIEATAKTADGTEIKIMYQHEESLHVEQTQQPQQGDPLVVDLDGNGADLTDATKGGGVRFDLNADGNTETVSWVGPADGLLAMDRNGNGVIDNGAELFGDQHGAVDGFAELAKLDANRDGAIDAKDAAFSSLKIWRDANQNGVSEATEVRSLSDYGITSLGLTPDGTKQTVAGNTMAGYASYATQSAGGKIGEAWLNYFA